MTNVVDKAARTGVRTRLIWKARCISLALLSAVAIANAASPPNPFLLPPFKDSAIVVAAANGDLEAVKRLLQQGVSPNEQECEDATQLGDEPCKMPGWTPLMMSAGHGHIEVVRVLLAAGADREIRDGGGRTAIWYAEQRGSADIIGLLKGAN